MRRVVVTGMGAVTPIGIGVEAFWENVKKKTLGFGEITRFDTTDYKVHIAAEVKDFVGKDYMDFKAAKRMGCKEMPDRCLLCEIKYFTKG